MKCVLQYFALCVLFVFARAAYGDLALNSEGVRASVHVKSLLEMRHAGVVIQKWDKSCGSAALSTLMTYYLGIPFDETTIISDMVRHGDPLRVRERGGFSLLDLKRFAQRHGYRSDGYGHLSLKELTDFNLPAIVPIRERGYDHFIIFAGLRGDRVIIADPAYGNASLTRNQFMQLWQNGIALFVYRHDEMASNLHTTAPLPLLAPVGRSLRGMGPVPALRVGY